MNVESSITTTMNTLYESLVASLKQSENYNKHDHVAPAVVLWPDKERLWEPLLSRLRIDLPILTLGPYDPQVWIGPAIWLRCMIDRTLPNANWPQDTLPILYLPGVSKQELRAVEECPKHLQPLAELQYRGVLFTQRNGRDWTLAAFLQSSDGGLEIPVASDVATREALHRALVKLADEPIASLRMDAPLTAAKLNAFLNPEPVRHLLLWMNDPVNRRAAMPADDWTAFRAICRDQFGFDPEADGEVTAAALLGRREGLWSTVWNRFAEAPAKYPNLPDLLRRARPAKSDDLFDNPSSWPQDNDEAEAILQKGLAALKDMLPDAARSGIIALEHKHGERRDWVWAELGHSPLASTLPALVALAEVTKTPLGGSTPDDIALSYTSAGWRADAAVLAALDGPVSSEGVAAVKAAIDAVYRPWLRTTAESFQQTLRNHPMSSGRKSSDGDTAVNGRCVLFADGLRFDVAQLLAGRLSEVGLQTALDWKFCALPGVTPTSKPAVSPAAAALGPGTEFGTVVKEDGARVTADILRREIGKMGFRVLSPTEIGDPSGSAWTEAGHLDSYGHEQGWRLATRITEEVREIAARVAGLLDAGWREVKVVTDHGWLLLPGGLPKVDLPEHLTEARKGRCARLRPASKVEHQTVPWLWDKNVAIAVAPGIGCYIANKEYEHGGLSPQECVVPVLTVTAPGVASESAVIGEIRWTGMRCRVQVKGGNLGFTVDLRTKAADASTSLVTSPKALDAEGRASIVVPDDGRAGDAAVVVLLSSDAAVLTQRATIVGEEV